MGTRFGPSVCCWALSQSLARFNWYGYSSLPSPAIAVSLRSGVFLSSEGKQNAVVLAQIATTLLACWEAQSSKAQRAKQGPALSASIKEARLHYDAGLFHWSRPVRPVCFDFLSNFEPLAAFLLRGKGIPEDLVPLSGRARVP